MCCKNCKNEVSGSGTVAAAAALPQRGKKRVRTTKLTSFTSFFFSLRIFIQL
jgi:hypothetical protein